MKNVSAATLINVFNGTSNKAPLVGAYISDTYFGHFKTLGFASVSSLLGVISITLMATFSALHPPQCSAQSTACVGPASGQLAFLLVGLGLLVIGAATMIVYVQSNGSWPIGFAIPTGLMLLSCALLFLGSGLYVKVRPDGSPLTSLTQLLVAAIRKRWLTVLDQPAVSLFNHVSKKFLDKSAVIMPVDRINIDGSASNSRRLCNVQQVEEMKCVLRVIPIWASAIIYHLANAQNHTYDIFQALQLDRRLSRSTDFKIPAASYTVFTSLSLTLWVPVYDRILVPALKGHRQGLVEERRRSDALTKPSLGVASKGEAISSMSGFWLVPQLAIGGLSEAFTLIGLVEFYYKQFPENMRSIAGAFSTTATALSSYLSGYKGDSGGGIVELALEEAGGGPEKLSV
ncbi:hypothetical protein CRG98_042384 [Punica granatum]|uniref:Uncharacterized protein n=1 Tax=Punica granatum TaxID=22663 RepID=A0A2I0HZV4_PUNGR|nr:hypothetical protein CRG98_042384 [Punica granatum]